MATAMPLPDLSRDGFLARHRNPWGRALRAATFLALGWVPWPHVGGLAAGLILVEPANWLLMPPRTRAPGLVENVIQRELAILDRPPSAGKALAALSFFGGLARVGAGLWLHAGTVIGLDARAQQGRRPEAHRIHPSPARHTVAPGATLS